MNDALARHLAGQLARQKKLALVGERVERPACLQLEPVVIYAVDIDDVVLGGVFLVGHPGVLHHTREFFVRHLVEVDRPGR